jgi:hypothetical protein
VQAPAGPGQPGVNCRFWVRNVRQEDAALTLEQIARGDVDLCILPWVPLMKGADQAEVIRRWQELALRQDQPSLLADYVALASVFAELAGRDALWRAALKELDVKDSRVAEEWVDKGRREGAAVLRASVLRVLGARFPSADIPESVPPALEQVADLEQLSRCHDLALKATSLEQFQKDLASSLPASGTPAPTP